MWRTSEASCGVVAAVLATLIGLTAAFPNAYAGFALDDTRRPVYRGNVRTRESKSDADREVIVRSDISVMDGRTMGISSTVSPTTATPIAESLKMVTKQLLQAPTATDMVATDVRTPPRVKSQVKGDVNTDFVPVGGKGEAHPVVLDDTSAYEVITAAPLKSSTATVVSSSTTPGLSTWILLSNGEQSTLATKKKNTVQPTVEPKKKVVTTPSTTASTTHIPEKNTKKPEEMIKPMGKPGIVKPVPAPNKKGNITREEFPPKTSPLVLQDSKFKNRTPVVVGRIPAIEKPDINNNTIKKVSSSQGSTTVPTTIITKKKTPSNNKYPSEIVPTTSLLLETDTIETVDETSTTEATSSTTKRTRRPTNKNKKKKNKNRRRRPTKPDADTAESKITEETTGIGSKIEANGPISTRIYNYLAREVMPSVGVGIVGLVLTAGLAGLFLYPFGGGLARRNYDKAPNPIGGESHMYYYNSYAPQEPEPSNAQPEEKVFGQVLSGINQNTFNPSPPYNVEGGTKFTTNNHKYRYDMNDYNVNGYAGNTDYSTLPDSVKNGGDYPPSSDSSKYYSMDPVSTHYKLTDNSQQTDSFNKAELNNYPSLTEYTSYTNAASVGTINSYENTADGTNETSNMAEDKSDKSSPQFSALVGSPQFTNSDFVGSVSLSGSYGAQEVRHRTGALAAAAATDLGPRSLQRSKRDVHDDFTNEIDSTDEKLLRKPTEIPPSTKIAPIKIESTTTNIITTTIKTDDGTTTANYEQNTASADAAAAANIAETSTEFISNNILNTNGNNEEKDNPNTTDKPDDTTTTTSSDGGFISFLKKVAQMKLKLGITFLKNTGEAFQRYVNVMAKRMETAIRNMENNRRSSPSPTYWTSISSSREKRYVTPPLERTAKKDQ